jgi:hypothetical protein
VICTCVGVARCGGRCKRRRPHNHQHVRPAGGYQWHGTTAAKLQERRRWRSPRQTPQPVVQRHTVADGATLCRPQAQCRVDPTVLFHLLAQQPDATAACSLAADGNDGDTAGRNLARENVDMVRAGEVTVVEAGVVG